MGASAAIRIGALTAAALLVVIALVTDRPDDDAAIVFRAPAPGGDHEGPGRGTSTTTTTAHPTTTVAPATTEGAGETAASSGTDATGAGGQSATTSSSMTTPPSSPDPGPGTPPPAVTAPVPVAPAAGTDPGCEQELVSLANAARAAAGIPTLTVDGGLTSMARRWARSMADRGSLAHNPDRAAELSAVIPGWHWIGENVGYATSVATIHSNWMTSSVHRGNILSRDLQLMGVGCVRDADGRYWAAQDFAGR